MESPKRRRWARVRPELAWKHPGLPAFWVRVLERNPEAMKPDPLPGYMWLDTPGKVLHANENQLEFTHLPLRAAGYEWRGRSTAGVTLIHATA
jgi:hypothetical protein